MQTKTSQLRSSYPYYLTLNAVQQNQIYVESATGNPLTRKAKTTVSPYTITRNYTEASTTLHNFN